MVKDIHKGGRPEKYDKDFYKAILEAYEDHSLYQLAKIHNVSPTTVHHWVKKGRKLYAEQQEA